MTVIIIIIIIISLQARGLPGMLQIKNFKDELGGTAAKDAPPTAAEAAKLGQLVAQVRARSILRLTHA
jgi:hypothetical protein